MTTSEAAAVTLRTYRMFRDVLGTSKARRVALDVATINGFGRHTAARHVRGYRPGAHA